MNIQTDQTPNKKNLGQAPLVDTQQVAKKYFPKVPVVYEKATNVLHLIWLVNQRCWFNFWLSRVNLPRYTKQILQRFQSNRKLNWSPAPPISMLRKNGSRIRKKNETTPQHWNWGVGGGGVKAGLTATFFKMLQYFFRVRYMDWWRKQATSPEVRLNH